MVRPARSALPEVAKMQDAVENSFQLDTAERVNYFGGFRELTEVRRLASQNRSYFASNNRASALRKQFEQAVSIDEKRKYFKEWSRAREYDFEFLKVVAEVAGVAPRAGASVQAAPVDAPPPPKNPETYQ